MPGLEREAGGAHMASNGIAHDDHRKLGQARSDGWPLTLRSADRWRSALDGLAQAMDRVVGARESDDVEAESGRGLLLVEALSSDWGAYVPDSASGKVVWAVVSGK